MSNTLLLLSTDDKPVSREDVLRLFQEKGQRSCFNSIDTGGSLGNNELLYFWGDEDLGGSIREAIDDGDESALEKLGDRGVLAICMVNVFPHVPTEEYTAEELQEMPEEMGKDYASAVINGKIQYQIFGLLGGLDDDTQRAMREMQFKTVQALAYLRGGMIMDSGTLRHEIVAVGTWSSAEILG